MEKKVKKIDIIIEILLIYKGYSLGNLKKWNKDDLKSLLKNLKYNL